MFSKKVVALVLVLVLFSLNVPAASLNEAYSWLNSQTPSDVYSASWALLALAEVNGGNSFIQYLESEKDQADCWPKNSCKARETAMAALALSKAGKNIDKSLDWLKSHQDISLTGEWLLQIKTESTGTCDITYTTTQLVTKKINVDKGFITSDKCTTPGTFFNLGNCLDQNLLSTKASLSFDIKCGFSGDISSVYRDSGVYFLNDDVKTGNQANIIVNNGNFGNYEDTLITNWALSELNLDINSLIYLRKNYKENDIKSSAFLYLLTQKQSYSTELSNLQKADKSFGNVFDTAVSIKALDDGQHQTQIDPSRLWLDQQQDKKDFSWNKNVLDTSVVLHSAYPNDGITLGEVSSLPSETETQVSQCNEDGICDFGEDALSCQLDCSCGDNVCDSSESSSSCSKDCEEEQEEDKEAPAEEQEEDKEEKSFGFLWFILIVIILGILGFLVYKKMPSLKTKTQPRERPSFVLPKVVEKPSEFKGPFNLLKPIAKVKAVAKSKVEEDLEKSLKEARKLLEK
ncbi:MAG: hypothetical protein AABW58_00130 [Nanoarchaeota archaeon]